jgi:hypothetical protein
MCGDISGDMYDKATETRIRLRDLSAGFKKANCPDAARFLANISELIMDMEAEIARFRLKETCKKIDDTRENLMLKVGIIQMDLEETG